MAKNDYLNHIPPFFVILPNVCEKISENREHILKIIKDIEEFSSEMNSEFFFIRSSTHLEDKIGIPTAGLFLSLGRIPKKQLKTAIIKCIMSTREEKIEKILNCLPATAVIIQKMIFCFSSGVLFTSHPVLNDKTQIVIEAGYGLGKTVVSGSFNIDHYEIDKNNLNNILKYDISEKYRYISSHSNTIEYVPKNLRKKSVLSDDKIISLSKKALNLEKLYKKPIDLEWGIDLNGKIWFFQIRDAQ